MDNLLPRHTIINIMIVQSKDSYQQAQALLRAILIFHYLALFYYFSSLDAAGNLRSYLTMILKLREIQENSQVSDIIDEGM